MELVLKESFSLNDLRRKFPEIKQSCPQGYDFLKLQNGDNKGVPTCTAYLTLEYIPTFKDFFQSLWINDVMGGSH